MPFYFASAFHVNRPHYHDVLLQNSFIGSYRMKPDMLTWLPVLFCLLLIVFFSLRLIMTFYVWGCSAAETTIENVVSHTYSSFLCVLYVPCVPSLFSVLSLLWVLSAFSLSWLGTNNRIIFGLLQFQSCKVLGPSFALKMQH